MVIKKGEVQDKAKEDKVRVMLKIFRVTPHKLEYLPS
jgi:hypothetical protein